MKNDILMKLFNIQYPIIQTPMTEFMLDGVAELSNKGCLGSIAAGYMNPDNLNDAIKIVRSQTARPFQVNLFTPKKQKDDIREVEYCTKTMIRTLNLNGHHLVPEFIKEYEYLASDQRLHDLIEMIIAHNIPIVSFSFGVPSDEIIQKLKDNNIKIIGTATHILEANLWEYKGADVIVLQGLESYGHRETFIHDPLEYIKPSIHLIKECINEINLPLIASGGIYDIDSVNTAFLNGASAVYISSPFLTSSFSKLNNDEKNALLNSNPYSTTLTSALTGKITRIIKNEGIKKIELLIPKPLPFYAQELFIKRFMNQSNCQLKPIFTELIHQYPSLDFEDFMQTLLAIFK